MSIFDGYGRRYFKGPGYSHFGINHILSTGQSLSIGYNGNPALSTTQPYSNLMFVGGPLPGGAGIGLASLVPHVESSVETHQAGCANSAAALAAAGNLEEFHHDHVALSSGHGVGSAAYALLKKGTTPYSNGMAQVDAGVALAAAAGAAYCVRCVNVVHGEADSDLGTANYDTDMLQWQTDYEADVKSRSHQLWGVPMFHSQISSWTGNGFTTSLIPYAQLAAAAARPSRIYIVGPKYMLPYVDLFHLTNQGYRWLGELYAKAYRMVVARHQPWVPLQPASVSRVGAVIDITFSVPVSPLVVDTVNVTDPGNLGFEFYDDAGPSVGISSVVLTGATTVRVTLTGAPTGGSKRIRYAYTGTAFNGGGPTTGPRGCLRDSDAAASLYGYNLWNWCVHFDEAAT